tara:strand:+ start:107 stop:403 length:297 start_codon:yes stop_codon:yes gene_type:complete
MFVPNYEEWTIEELTDVFIEIDDNYYSNKALTILKHLALRFKVELRDVTLNHIILNPTESFGRETYIDVEYGLSESYTRDAVVVRDKLIRLKAIENDT